MQEILINQIQTPDGTILRSYDATNTRSSYNDKNGKLYSVEGGTKFLRRVAVSDYKELSVLTHDPFEKIRLYWQPTVDKYLCELTTLEIWDSLIALKSSDWYYKEGADDKQKEQYVVLISLLLQERLFRQKYKNYCKQVRRTITEYKNQTLGFVEIGKLLAQKISESEHPFGEIQRIYEKSKTGNRIYHRLVCLVKEWMDKHSFAKVSEYETEKVLGFILKPLEEK